MKFVEELGGRLIGGSRDGGGEAASTLLRGAWVGSGSL